MVKTWLCEKSEAESAEIIDEFCKVDKGTTPDDNDDGRCIIIVSDIAQNNVIAEKYKLKDVSDAN